MVTRNYWWPEVTKEVKQYRRIQLVSENEEQSRNDSRKIKTSNRIDKRVEQDVGNRSKAINSFSSTNRCINRESKSRAGIILKYIYIYVNHRQNNQSEWLTTTEFVFNNKIHIVMNLLLFKINYGQELRIGFKIRKKEKYMKAEKFVKEMKKMYEEAKVMLKKLQKKINIQIGIER